MSQQRLNYHVHPGSGPYLGLLHGFLSSAKQWQLNLEALSEVCTPVTIELWGHGDSPTPDNPEAYTPQAYIQELEHIRQALGADKWLLCGYSLGAGITVRYTHQHPERVIAHGFTNSSSGFASAEVLANWQRDLPATASKILAKGQQAIERIAVHPKYAKRLPTEIYDALVEDAKKLTPIAVANTLLHTNILVSTRDIVGTNPRPALFTFGHHEKRFSSTKDWIVENMQHLHIAELEAGHAVNMEDVSGFNHAWQEFIGEHCIPKNKMATREDSGR